MGWGATSNVSLAAPDVDCDKQEQPNNVHKVPVPSRGFETEVVGRREVAAIDAQQADEQEDGADDDVETVEAGRHEEVRAINVAAKAKGRVAVLISLEYGEDQAKADCKDQAGFYVFAVIFVNQGVVSPSRSRTRAQQDQGIDQRQVPWVKGFDTDWGPNAINRRAQPVGMHRVHRVLEEAPEPRKEEHDFRHDEQDEAVAQANQDNRCVIANLVFRDGFRPPTKHDVQNANKPDEEHPRAVVGHPHDGAEKHDETCNRTQQGPDGGVQNVIIVVLGVGHILSSFRVSSKTF